MWVLLFVYAAALLSVGLTRDWRLLHEDNGALHTMFAATHLELGLERTRAHDLFFRPQSGEALFYGHHPPGTSLALAGAFALTGTDAPWLARSVAIAFHLASLGLLIALLRLHLTAAQAFLGGLLFATLPMSAYFGRMVNYEALCLTGVMAQLYGYARWRIGSRAAAQQRDTGGGFAWLAAGIVLGGLVDWPAFFFAAALGLTEAVAALRGDRDGWRRFWRIALVAGATFVFDLAHLAFAADSLAALRDVAGGAHPDVAVSAASLVAGELAHGRRYFGRGALLASALLGTALLWRRAPLGSTLGAARHPEIFTRWLGASGLAALAYVLAAPSWAIVHVYWSFYFLPFVTTALVLAASALSEIAVTRRNGARLAPAALLLALLLDVGITATRTLVKRHGTPEPFAIERTHAFRQQYVPPRSWR